MMSELDTREFIYLHETKEKKELKYCKYKCGTRIFFAKKKGKRSTGWFEASRSFIAKLGETNLVESWIPTSIEHTYDRCRQILTEKGLPIPFD